MRISVSCAKTATAFCVYVDIGRPHKANNTSLPLSLKNKKKIPELE